MRDAVLEVMRRNKSYFMCRHRTLVDHPTHLLISDCDLDVGDDGFCVMHDQCSKWEPKEDDINRIVERANEIIGSDSK